MPGGIQRTRGVRMSIFRKSNRLVLACRMLVAVWMLQALFLLCMLAVFAQVGPASVVGGTIQGSLALSVIILPIELCIAWGLRCPACRGWVLLQTFGPFHPAARIVEPGGHYAAVVLDVLRHRRFTCMYCGRTCRVSSMDEHSVASGGYDGSLLGRWASNASSEGAPRVATEPAWRDLGPASSDQGRGRSKRMVSSPL
jgi:hypothetical protein